MFWGSVVAFFLLLPLTALSLVLASEATVVPLAISGGLVLISLFALPITGAVALGSRLRCRLCGHRFWPAHGVPGPADDVRFPVRYGFVGGAILLVSLGVGLSWVIDAPGTETLESGFMPEGRIILAGLAFGIGLLAQTCLWRRSCYRLAGVRGGLTLLLPAIVLSAGWLSLTAHDNSRLYRKYGPLVRAPWVLGLAQLADLPESASRTRVYMFGWMGSMQCYLRFAAEPGDIERFLSRSASLQGLAYQTYSKHRMRLASSDFGDGDGDLKPDGHEYFYRGSHPPYWYKDEIRGAARRYPIRLGENRSGEVIVDDERHVVYVEFVVI